MKKRKPNKKKRKIKQRKQMGLGIVTMSLKHRILSAMNTCLARLKKNSTITAYSRNNMTYHISFKDSHDMYISIVYSEHYKTGLFLPKLFLEEKGLVSNSCIIWLGVGEMFSSADASKLYRMLLKNILLPRQSGYILEERFYEDVVAYIASPENVYGLVSIRKTDALEEQAGDGDFVLTFSTGAEFNLDLKSSMYGVLRFQQKKNQSVKLVLPLNYLGFKEGGYSIHDLIQRLSSLRGKNRTKKQNSFELLNQAIA
ncbi:hypothetical protein KC866_03825 [Patescibacteria group bacterium]|nr:hypothetical protein [Patescibacteria group bacterium]